MVTSNSADIVRRLREFAAYGEDSRGRVLAQLALTEIERLRPYVEAFRREETRADKLGQEIDDLRASLTTASGEAARATRHPGTDAQRRKERVSMAREICLHRGENPNTVDRGGNENWEKYEPLAGACIREAERLFAMRDVAQARPACKAECDGQMQLAMAEIERLEALRETTIEECAQVAEAQKEQYDSNQPFGSLCERFACDEVAKAIRDLSVSSPQRGTP